MTVGSASPSHPAPEIDAGRAIAEALADAGTELLFGVPGGGSNLALVDACQSVGIRFVLAHGETSAAIMAGTYGELTGRPGACVVTRGPGAASVVNGVAHAQLDRVPLIVVTDGVARRDRERVTHQLIDHRALLGPVTKWSAEIGVGGLDTARAAVRLACASPPGAVHLDVVADAVATVAPESARASTTDAASVEQAIRLLRESRSPVFAFGVGARAHAGEVGRLVAERPWPCLTTYKAKGIVPESSGCAAGLLTGATVEAPVLHDADLVIAVGVDPVELIPAPWPYDARVLTIDEWPIESEYLPADVRLVGPLEELLALVREQLPAPRAPSEARDRRVVADASVQLETEGLAPHEVVLAARRHAPNDAIATLDAGAHMLVAMPLWQVEAPGRALISSGLATMGFALPAAIAAALVRPGARAVCFVGDGGLGMTLAELETAARLGLRVTVVVFNDSALSLIEIKQRTGASGGHAAVRYGDTDFAAVAAGLGVAGRRVRTVAELDRALSDALALDGPMLIDAVVDPARYRDVLAAIRG